MPRSAARTGAIRRAITLATVASLLLLTVGVIPASAATLARFPTTNAAYIGTWTSPESAYDDDGVYATTTLTSGEESTWEYGGFGFDSIPAGAAISSVSLEIEFKVSRDDRGDEVRVQAALNGTRTGSAGVNTSQPTTDTILTTSSTGITTRDQLLDGTFSVLVSNRRPAGANNPTTLSLDYVKVTVEYAPPPNQPPTIDPVPDQTVAAGTTVTYQVAASDPEGDTLTYGSTAFPAWASIDAATGLITMSPPEWAPASSYFVGVYVADPLYPAENSHSTSTQFTITVTPDQPPTIDPVPDQTVAAGATVTYQVAASDPEGGTLTYGSSGFPAWASIDPATGLITMSPPANEPASSYAAEVAVADPLYPPDTTHIAYAYFTINVTPANQPPVLAPIADQTIAENATGSIAVNATDPDGDVVTLLFYGASVGDPLPAFVTPDYPGGIGGSATLDLAPGFSDAGTYPITVVATSAGGFVTRTFTITVTNTNRAPVASNQSVATSAGTPVDVTLVATDPDGDQLTYIIASQPAHGTVTLAANVATYTPDPGYSGPDSFTFTAWDGFLEASPATVSVAVADTTDPVVTVPADITTEATGPGGAAVTFSASATDDVDGALTPTCTPASGSTFPLGATMVTCTATDVSGNTGSATFRVTVADTMPPVVTVPADITTEATGSAGAPATFTASATDLVDGSLTPTCTPASGSTFPLGATTVTCTATDASGNTGSTTFTVTVADTTAPTITTPDGTTPPDLTVPATGPNGAVVSFVLGATDGVDGQLSATCSPASGSLFPVGTTTVTCTATDRTGNVAGATFEVAVTPYEGPVPTTPPTSTEGQAAAGVGGVTSALPVIWLLGMAGALGILAVGVRRHRHA